MRALEPEVVDAVWSAIEPLIPPAPESHPLGCHRPRVSDRLCSWGILVRLVTVCSGVSVQAILDRQVSYTTLRARRDEWIAAGVSRYAPRFCGVPQPPAMYGYLLARSLAQGESATAGIHLSCSMRR
jgi:hypothetical protein